MNLTMIAEASLCPECTMYLLGPIVYGGVLIVFILQLQIFRKNMQQACSNTSQVLYNNLSLQISSLGMMCQADHYARRSDLIKAVSVNIVELIWILLIWKA
jgi:hypothetical protein